MLLLRAQLREGAEHFSFPFFVVHLTISGRNPQSGEPITLPPRRVVTFHYSAGLKEKINREDEEQSIKAKK
jgi:hypothetical protein